MTKTVSVKKESAKSILKENKVTIKFLSSFLNSFVPCRGVGWATWMNPLPLFRFMSSYQCKINTFPKNEQNQAISRAHLLVSAAGIYEGKKTK